MATINPYIGRSIRGMSSCALGKSARYFAVTTKQQQAIFSPTVAGSHATMSSCVRLTPVQMQNSMIVNRHLMRFSTMSNGTRLFTSTTDDMLLSRLNPSYKINATYTSRRSFWRKAFKPPKPPSPPKFNYKIDLEHTLKSLQGIHHYVKNNLSLDLWTINLLLLGFVAGPSIYNAMKNSPHTEDDYMFSIPVDDPVEHSVRILMELNHDESVLSSTDEEKSLLKSTFNNPEDDAKRILNELLASDQLRTTASRIASGVIQSPPFQNACKVLVRNIWDDLINDPETNKQLVALVQSVVNNERVYNAVKEMMIQLVNDEEVYKELTKLVVQLGEEKEVLDATQRLLTESTHKTLNDPSVLDHSMEFATEVVGDDVVQRSGGEALRNTLGYAVQPSGGAILVSIGTMIVAGAIHFYFFRGKGGGFDEGWLSPRPSFDSLSTSSDFRSRSFESNAAGNNVISTLFHSTWNVVSNIVSFPVLLAASIYNGIRQVCSYPQQAISYSSEKLQSGVSYITALPGNLWTKIATFPSWLGGSAKSGITSIVSGFHIGAANLGRSCMESINSTSKTTKGALVHILSTINASCRSSIESLTMLISSMKNKWANSNSSDDTQAVT